MTKEHPSKYGSALTGSDWIGLPLRIGHIPESGSVEGLSNQTDTILIWSGGTTEVGIEYRNPGATENSHHQFTRTSGTMDLIPGGTQLKNVSWQGDPSICTSVNLPVSCLIALRSTDHVGLNPARGARFGLIDAHVVDLVGRLQSQAEGVESFGAVYVQSLSLALASYISARYGSQSKSDPPLTQASLSAQQRKHLVDFVEQELASNFGLVDLASLVGYCPDHFSRLFKTTFQQSPHQYVLSRRVERAMTMLRDKSRPIAEIARTCGFSSQGHLNSAFKNRTGLTPGAYRKR